MIADKEDETNEKENPKPTKPKTVNITNCINPVLVLEHIFGIFRFRITNQTLRPTSGPMKLFGLFMTTIVTIIFIISFDVTKILLSGKLELVDVVKDFPTVVILIQYVSSAVMTSCLLSKANIRIVTLLADLDLTLHINTCDDFYKKSKNCSIIALVVVLTVHFISSISDFFLETTDASENVTEIIGSFVYYLLNLVQDLEILLFFLMIHMLKCRLKVINHYLVKFIHDDDSQDKISVYTIRQRNAKTKNNFNLLRNFPVSNLGELSLAYDIIGDTCRLINTVYNFQIFMTLISAFVYIVIALWTSLYYFQYSNYAGANIIAIFLWCSSEMLTVASMAFVCETLLSTRDDTKVLVNKLVMDYGLPASARAQAKAFMELIDAWPLRIFVYDMFSVDITLMLKFISVSTTYLIVIIQISHFM
ncbi:uncharacterized protein [Choristoneura fumiferana]|uniref:uncharacterized protein n=1 Tax=Choristoneura fumiferana TaxID=7141 RepID=UPI003D154109